MNLTDSQLDAFFATLKPHELGEVQQMLDALESKNKVDRCKKSLIEFCKHIMQGYKAGTHLKRLATLLQDVQTGAKDRILVNMAPRFGKSQMISILFPAWYLGHNPTHKMIIASHTADLAVDMLRKVRNVIMSDEYREIFPSTQVMADAKAAGKWNTTLGGEAYAIGTGGALAGRGADILIIDDPFSEQDVLNGNYEIFEKVYEWYAYGARTRLMPGGKVAILHTRWSQRDLTARLLKDGQTNPDADQFELFEFPAVLTMDDGSEKSLWPEQWTLESLNRTKASMPLFQWNAQYLQNPTGADAAIIKREQIQYWTKDDPPECEFIVQGWDTALTTKTRSDYSVCQTWGVFYTGQDENRRPNAILLNRVKGKWEFPDLKRVARTQYENWKPDSLIIETKASGQPLVDELRRGGIYVGEYSPGKGQDKLARLNSVTDMFAAGQVWVPEGRRWAEEVVEEWVSFPGGEHDDEVDCLEAGTLIEMADGSQRPVEQVVDGDMVRTPWGPRRVGYATCTGEKELYEVSYGEHRLVMSGEHPIATKRGWIKAREVTPDDIIVTVSTTEELSWLFPKTQTCEANRSCLTAGSTTDTLTLKMPHTGVISCVAEAITSYIETSGKLQTAQYPKGMRFTTWMGTTATTPSQTSQPYQRPNTKTNTAKQWRRLAADQSSWRIWPKLKLRLQNGTRHLKDASGTANTLKIKDLASLHMSVLNGAWSVLCVTRSLFQRAPRLCTAASSAGTSGFMSSSAPNVQRLERKAKTYNFSVPGPECYYANGVLVHNCMTLCLIRIRKGGLLPLATDYEDNDEDAQAAYSAQRAYY